MVQWSHDHGGCADSVWGYRSACRGGRTEARWSLAGTEPYWLLAEMELEEVGEVAEQVGAVQESAVRSVGVYGGVGR